MIIATPARSRLLKLTRKDWIELAFLGSIGTFLYQFCFVSAVKRTSVGNGSLIIGISPIVIAMMSAVVGHERIRPMRWLGIAVAMCGLYLVVGRGVDLTGQTWRGDALMMAGVLCWATYSVASQGILKRESPLIVIALTFSIGATLYVLTMTPILIATDWRAISGFSWLMMADVRTARAQSLVLDLVHRAAAAGGIAHLGLQLPHAGRRDAGRGVLAGRADLGEPDRRRGRDSRRPVNHAISSMTPSTEQTRQRTHVVGHS